MSQREHNKQEKRERIVAAATQIIADDGIDALTMRRLADEAGVSSRTPYNLFDSKTQILVAILLQTIEPFGQPDPPPENDLAVAQLLQRLEVLLNLDKKSEVFFRSVYWSIMRSDDMESKTQGRTTLTGLIGEHINTASNKGELKSGCNTGALINHISTLLISILGLWADSQINQAEMVSHTRHAWVNSLLPHARGKALRYLRENSGDTYLETYSGQVA